jgi:type VI secretion system protein ImpF
MGQFAPFFLMVQMAQLIRVRKSVFDRLLMDASPQDGVLPVQSVEQLRDTVARDLEWLLNSRVGLLSAGQVFGEHVGRSIVGFGVSDFSNCLMSSYADREYISGSIASSIEAHEPRLRNVRVEFRDMAVSGGALSFVIRAVLVLSEAKELVNFDAVLQPSASKYKVTRAGFSVE